MGHTHQLATCRPKFSRCNSTKDRSQQTVDPQCSVTERFNTHSSNIDMYGYKYSYSWCCGQHDTVLSTRQFLHSMLYICPLGYLRLHFPLSLSLSLCVCVCVCVSRAISISISLSLSRAFPHHTQNSSPTIPPCFSNSFEMGCSSPCEL